ncbi:YhcB family protein [Methylophaga sp. OBS4]|uniref:YhcB family protein n=1 Tax=Methylophaga sp. OBS4 TaxID=2991935 RepID=UPI0022590920|nr:DUF1043 family protein [Methylophaga sp. OBS4]MCX4186664.1 YhcB family protein [Methylophaga sp. OBS4]
MSSTEFWSILVIAVIFAALIGFALGRRKVPGGTQQLKDLQEQHEQQLAQKQMELEAYQEKVHEHYDKTATLFKDMAGSYKELFDHLSTGYEQLGNFSDRRVLPERAGALLDGPDTQPKAHDFMNPKSQDEDALNR